MARQEVGAATRAVDLDASSPSVSSAADRRKTGRTIGPTLPSSSDLTLLRESAAESRAAELSYAKKRARKEEKERIEDLVGPKEVGREGMLEKKRARREEGRANQAAKEDAFGEFDEGTLMGGGDSFKARCFHISFTSIRVYSMFFTELRSETPLADDLKKSD